MGKDWLKVEFFDQKYILTPPSHHYLKTNKIRYCRGNKLWEMAKGSDQRVRRPLNYVVRIVRNTKYTLDNNLYIMCLTIIIILT